MQGFKVSNFRLFDRNGVKVEFSPITILTGINSSGKSSFVKAMVLVGDFIESIRDAYKKDGTFDINAASLNFSRQELLLKGFKSSINRRSLDDFPYIRFAVDVNLGSYLGTYTVEYGFKEGMSAFGPDSAVIDTISIKSHEKEFFLAKANGNRLRVDTFNVSSCLLGSFWDTLLLCVLPADVIGKYSHPIDGLYSEFRSEDGLYENYDKLAETPEGIRLFEMQNTRYPDQLDKAVFHLRNIISMPH